MSDLTTYAAHVVGLHATGSRRRRDLRDEPAPSATAISSGDRALIDAALAAGRVQACPTFVADGVQLVGLQVAERAVPGPGPHWREQIRDSFKRGKLKAAS